MKTFDDRMQLVQISGCRPWRPAKGGRTNITLPDESDPAPMARRRLAIRGLLRESAVLVAVYVAFVLARIKWWPPAFPTWYGTLSGVAIGMAPGLASIWLSRRMFRRMNAPPASLSGLCAACTHPLTGVSTDPDGCTVCPECGAAWRVTTDSPGESKAH